MILNFDTSIADNYTNNAQIARVLTENWVKTNGYCPHCGANHLNEYANNMPVADFFCGNCSEQFELKSKKGMTVGSKIVDGAYASMIERINSKDNPNFFFLTYDKSKWEVRNFMIIPKYFFVSDMIEKRKPLNQNARRAGWVGCNIDLRKVPESGRVFLIKETRIISKKDVCSKWKGTVFLKAKKSDAKGWILDVMRCVDAMHQDVFSLKDMYAFEDVLKEKYPDNRFVKDKIRQQLQLLRDKGLIEFAGNGVYKKATL